MAAGNLFVDNPAHVDARLANEITAEFDDDFGLGKFLPCFFGDIGEIGRNIREVNPALSWKIGNPESTA